MNSGTSNKRKALNDVQVWKQLVRRESSLDSESKEIVRTHVMRNFKPDKKFSNRRSNFKNNGGCDRNLNGAQRYTKSKGQACKAYIKTLPPALILSAKKLLGSII